MRSPCCVRQGGYCGSVYGLTSWVEFGHYRMIQMFHRGRGRRTIFLFASLLVCLARIVRAQPSGVSVAPPPDWVHEADWTAPEGPLPDDKSESTHAILSEEQDRPKTAEVFVRDISRMENASGVQDSGSLKFQFDPNYQTLVLHRVVIHRKGKTLDRLDAAKIRLIDPEPDIGEDMITGQKNALLFVEDLRVGDILEYAYTIRGDNPVLGDHYSTEFDLQTDEPTDRVFFRVVWDRATPLNVRSYMTVEKPVVRPFGGGTEYVWSLTNVPAVAKEDSQPDSYEPFPYVEVSDFTNWSDVVNWALPLYKITPTNVPPELQDLVSSWEASSRAPEEKVRAALEFVQDEVRYTGIELGPDSYQPADPYETFAKRYGDCKGKVNLMCLILQMMKIEAYPALVNAESHEAIANHLPSPFAFDHVILKLKLDGQYIYLDPTYSHQGGSLWDRYVPPYGKALVIRPGNEALENLTPENAGAVAHETATSTFTLTGGDSPVDFKVVTKYHGSSADDMRDHLATQAAADTAKDYLNFYIRVYPGIKVAKPVAVTDDRLANVLTVEEFYTITNLWKPGDAENERTADFYADNLYGVLTDPDTRMRKTPLSIAYPEWHQQQIVVHLPGPDWEIPNLTTNLESGAFSFHYHRELNGTTVKYDYDCKTKVAELPVGAVPQYLADYQHMQDLLTDTLQRPEADANRFQRSIGVIVGSAMGALFVIGGVTVAALWIAMARQKRGAVPPPLPRVPPVLPCRLPPRL